jgi:hypothetical protein
MIEANTINASVAPETFAAGVSLNRFNQTETLLAFQALFLGKTLRILDRRFVSWGVGTHEPRQSRRQTNQRDYDRIGL